MKKFISVLAIVAVLASAFAVGVSASPADVTGSLSSNKYWYVPGETVSITIQVYPSASISSISSFVLALNYETDSFEFTGMSLPSRSILKDYVSSITFADGKPQVTLNSAAPIPVSEDVTMTVKADFKIKDDAYNGQHSFRFNNISVVAGADGPLECDFLAHADIMVKEGQDRAVCSLSTGVGSECENGVQSIIEADGTGHTRYGWTMSFEGNAPKSYGAYIVNFSNLTTTLGMDNYMVKYDDTITSGQTFAVDLTDIPAEMFNTKFYAFPFADGVIDASGKIESTVNGTLID